MPEKSRKRRIDVAIAVLAVVVVACAVWFGYYLGRYSVAADVSKAVGEAASAMQGQAAASASGGGAQPQVYETDAARVEYRDKVEPTTGNVMIEFALENKTGETVAVSGENVVVNGEYGVGTLGGSAAPIAPGATGSVSLLFGYSTQTPLASADEVKSVSCELVMRDGDSHAEVGRVPVSAEV